ncbi:biotin-dependent carboxyltransferase family protein [Leifsonia sp. ZF2019]|uniref:5-oxoprolinase subunit C family protein n=1 Tax=Leifsonia sp. ZF2019 TaxID=2781978 RepID=UPI001CBB6FFC|nr:biotin-dependent carboxyltransferase family protein [Leifsonia sp. ZF2019]UAJ78773.1 biotin-dependent carboxyltransferase family protein [Leifsonia sp. ZF2019]
MSLRILEPGALALVQDLGRPGWASLGVSPSGALDRAALRLGNRLLGDDEGAAGLELLLGGFSARFETETWFAVTGADGQLELDGRSVDPHLAVRAPAGATLRIGPPRHGMRHYLAVRGGVDAHPVLGSRSRDTLAALGPEPLRAGDVLPFGATRGAVPALDFVPLSAPTAGPIELRAHRGPRSDWFIAAAVDAFHDTQWILSAESSRVGARLDPPAAGRHSAPLLERRIAAELPSEPMVAGSVQVSPDGRPTVLLADHPVTGGYPVIAVVADASLDLLAQARPGQPVTFRRA